MVSVSALSSIVKCNFCLSAFANIAETFTQLFSEKTDTKQKVLQNIQGYFENKKQK